jgi:hypothetical protein
MADKQTAIVPGTIGHECIVREFKNGFKEIRIKHFASPEWSNKKPRFRRIA